MSEIRKGVLLALQWLRSRVGQQIPRRWSSLGMTNTGEGRDLAGRLSDNHCFFVFSKYFSHGVGDFAYRGVRFYGGDDVRH
jgi:hypothetical protein